MINLWHLTTQCLTCKSPLTWTYYSSFIHLFVVVVQKTFRGNLGWAHFLVYNSTTLERAIILLKIFNLKNITQELL